MTPLPRGGMGSAWVLRDVERQLSPRIVAERPGYEGIGAAPFYYAVENLRERGDAVYSLFSTTEDPIEQAVWSRWDRDGLIARCGFGFRLDGHACDESIWNRLPTSAYVDDVLRRDHHTRTLLDNVAFHLVWRAQALEERGDLDGAVAALRTVDRCLPDDPRALARLFDLARRHGRTADADAAAAELLRRFPGDERVRALLDAAGAGTSP
ncbi:MAG: tetratricopeptide repeat protein [Deltaproteobacteria bacterium]|nr:tetratricopeptide repeat protein [Deltaproteobacteria bacterium]